MFFIDPYSIVAMAAMRAQERAAAYERDAKQRRELNLPPKTRHDFDLEIRRVEALEKAASRSRYGYD